MAETATFSIGSDRTECAFAEKFALFDRGQAFSESRRCLGCHDAPCISACPTSIDIPSFIEKIASENNRGAARVILESNLLGASCARICPVEVLCEGACVYKHAQKPAVPIGRLQRYAMDVGAKMVELERATTPTGYSVACVGAGPASLACAGRLALLGHEVVLYEKSDLPGGLGVSGIAPHKINAADALDEVNFILSLGVELKTGVEVGRDIDADEVFEAHGAVFCGVGLGGDRLLTVDGAEKAQVRGAVDWIAQMKLGKVDMSRHRRVAVIGGGNTAIDAVRELAALGADSVHMVYRRSEAEMSGYRHEWTAAKAEGVGFIPNAVVRRFAAADGGGVRLRWSLLPTGSQLMWISPRSTLTLY